MKASHFFKTCSFLGVVAAVLLLPVQDVLAITVTTTADSGAGSLRQALVDAPVNDTITFAGGVTGTITLTSGELVISKNLTITGPGAGALSISGNNTNRVLNCGINTTTLVISGLTIRNGRVEGTLGVGVNGGDISGGGIYNQGGVATLNNCMVSNNIAIGGSSTTHSGRHATGGGLYGQFILNNCIVVSNTAVGGSGPGGGGSGGGGGLYGLGILTACTFLGNTARGMDYTNTGGGRTGSGGGMYFSGGSFVTNCVVSQNLAQGGTGDNAVGGYGSGWGGGIYLDAVSVTLQSTTVTGNRAQGGNGFTTSDDAGEGDGGGIYASFSSANLVVLNSTISSNTAAGGTGHTPNGLGGPALGGGIYHNGQFGNLKLINCTVTTNSVLGGLGGDNASTADDLSGAGGGIYCTVIGSITNSTVSHNIASGATAGNGNRGGGLFYSGSSMILHGSIFAKNVGVGNGSPDVRGVFPQTSRYNLIGAGTVNLSGITNGINNNLVGTVAAPLDPLLGPLQNNGGPTLTYALLAGSPAIDKGLSGVTTTDQRGSVRPYDDGAIANAAGGDGADIGAFEVNGLVSPVITVTPSGAQVTISWTPNTAGFVLQERTNVVLGSWANSLSGATNPVTLSPTGFAKFYRAFHP